MELKKKKTIEYGEEAKWLMDVMQNPLHGENPDEEDETNKAMRNKFWSALKE